MEDEHTPNKNIDVLQNAEAMKPAFDSLLKVYVNEDCICIDRPGLSPYPVPLREVDTPEKLIGWLCQLSEKQWATPDSGVVRSVAHLAAQHHGFTVPGEG